MEKAYESIVSVTRSHCGGSNLGAFKDSDLYKNHVEPLPQGKMEKWVMKQKRRVKGIPKKGHQEYDFGNVLSTDEVPINAVSITITKNSGKLKQATCTRREKYGRKFLGEMLENGLLSREEYNEAIEEVSVDPATIQGDGKVDMALKKYYMTPFFDEEYELVSTPKSGFKLLDEYMMRARASENTEFLAMCKMVKVIRERRNDADAVQFFLALYDEMIKSDDDKVLANIRGMYKKPLDQIATALEPMRVEGKIKAFKRRFEKFFCYLDEDLKADDLDELLKPDNEQRVGGNDSIAALVLDVDSHSQEAVQNSIDLRSRRDNNKYLSRVPKKNVHKQQHEHKGAEVWT